MTMQSFPISSVGCDPARTFEAEDDLSTSTPPSGHRNCEEDHEFVSKTIRFYFAPTDRTRLDSTSPADVHTKWLRMITSTFGTEVKIINNNNKQVLHIDTNSKAAKGTSHGDQFKVHEKPMGLSSSGNPETAVVIVHRILTRIPLGQIKRNPSAFKFLIEHNCFFERTHVGRTRMGCSTNRIRQWIQSKVLLPRESHHACSCSVVQGDATSKSS